MKLLVSLFLFFQVLVFSHESEKQISYPFVVTPNGKTLPWTIENGVKVFHLIAETVEQEFSPGLVVNCWGYNGSSPGPTIEAFEGDRVRILVTNHLPEPTTVHWHGILLPNGMDGVTGLNQAPILPGETFKYEFVLRQHGTYMYHSHFDEMIQIGMGLMGFFIIHPKEPVGPPVDRDFAIMLHEWYIPAGASTPDPMVMLDFNYFTFNGRIYPGTQPLVVKKGERVRIRLANLSMDNHPIHLHGYAFTVMASGGWRLPQSAQYLGSTIDVVVGNTHDIEFVADEPGDWALHCHKTHHVMSGMEHNIPNMIGVDQGEWADKINKLLPEYMPMGETGMGKMFEMSHHMARPKNFLPYGSPGQFGMIDMSGMFTILKVRDDIANYHDSGWYENPLGTVAESVTSNAEVPEMKPEPIKNETVHHIHHDSQELKVGDLHPLILHFPIVLFFVAFVFDFLFLAGRAKAFHVIAHWIVIFAALLAIPTEITGLYAVDLGHADNPIVPLHRNWALITLAFSICHAFFRIYVIKTKKTYSGFIFVLISLINIGLIIITAEYGGAITRGKSIWLHLDSYEDIKNELLEGKQ